jgi:hypothetical protein
MGCSFCLDLQQQMHPMHPTDLDHHLARLVHHLILIASMTIPPELVV